VGPITAIQLYTPNELMGRVSGADNLLVNGAQSAGIAVCAALVGEIFYRDLCYFVGGMILLSSLYLASRKAQRRHADGPEPARRAREPEPVGAAEPPPATM
jgi:hypothetical protein